MASVWSDLRCLPWALLSASFVLLAITSWWANLNAVQASMGGYLGVGVGVAGLSLLVYPETLHPWNLLPYALLLVLAGWMASLVWTFQDILASGALSTTYQSLVAVGLLLMGWQTWRLARIPLPSVSPSAHTGATWLSPSFRAELALVGLVQLLVTLTLWVVLRFYTTQG
jgi:hypothetical protein